MSIRLAIAADHGGFFLKENLKKALDLEVEDIVDLGVHSEDSVDYPDQAHALAKAVLNGEADFGILICGTGIGVSMAANRHPGIRAALCTNSYMARMSREHNNANVLCLGGRVIGPALAFDIAREFLKGQFAGGRHTRRLAKIELK